MRADEIRPGEKILSIGPATEITFPLVEDGSPITVNIKGDYFELTVPAYCDIPVDRPTPE